MNRRCIQAAAIGSLIGSTVFSGVALAGEDKEPGAAGVSAWREALANRFFERMDANKDGQITRLEAELAGKSLFSKLDRNDDGAITKEEAESGARSVHKEELAAHFKTLDTDHDGRLKLDESKMPPIVFNRLDKDQDQTLTSEEFQAMPEMRGAHQQFEFERADSNHDGKVTRDEAARSVQQRFERADANKDGAITRAEFEARLNDARTAGAKAAAHGEQAR